MVKVTDLDSFADAPGEDNSTVSGATEVWGELPENATEPAINFYKQHAFDLHFVASETRLVDSLERIVLSVARGVLPSREPREAFPSLFKDVDAARGANEHNWKVRREIIITRYIDNYLTYLSDLLWLLLREMPAEFKSGLSRDARLLPETLDGRVSIQFEDVLGFASMDDLIKWLAEKKVQRLSLDGFRSMAKYFKSTLELNLLKDEKHARDLVRAIATRNLLVHKRGVVDSRYLNSLASEGIDVSNLVIGTRLDISDYVFVMDVVWESVRELESGAIAKFGVPTQRLDASGWWPDHDHEA